MYTYGISNLDVNNHDSFCYARPDDYFAEMAKSDEHMQKVRKSLMAKQAAQARVEKVRQLRDQKKIAKRVQVCILCLSH